MKMKPSDSAQQPIGQRENSIHITSKSWARKVDDKITLLHVWAALKVTNKQKKIHTHTRTWTNFGFDTTQRISSLKILDRSFWQQNHQTTFSHLNQYLTTHSKRGKVSHHILASMVSNNFIFNLKSFYGKHFMPHTRTLYKIWQRTNEKKIRFFNLHRAITRMKEK